MKRALPLALVLLGVAQAQTYNNATLNAKYYFRELYMVTDASGAPSEIRNASGAILFDGKGGYTVIATQTVGSGNPQPLNLNGTYNVASNAGLTLADPIKPALTLNARYTGEAVFGSTSEATDNTFAFFIAIPEPAGGYSVKSLSGNYFVSTLEITGGNVASARSALLEGISPDGKGGIQGFTMRGHAANVNKGLPTEAFSPGATYTVNSDGSGAIDFGPTDITRYISGNKPIFISKSGNIFIGGSSDAGVQDMMIGIRSAGATPGLSGSYFTAGLRIQSDPVHPTSYCYTGGVNTNGASSLFTRRVRQSAVATTFSFTGSENFIPHQGGTLLSDAYVVGPGAGGVFVQAAGSQQDPTAYEIGFGSAIPDFSGTGVFINPYGIVNAASNAPGGAPLSPGEFVTVFGANLASSTLQAGAPYPLTLGGVTITVNNIPAPIYLVSKNQINFLVPFNVTGRNADVVIKNSTGTSNTVTLPLASTSPGIYSVDYSGSGWGVVLHADYTLVTEAKPAKRGETVLVYLTGLGAVTPTVADGVAAPSDPLSKVALNAQQLLVYLDNMPAPIQFAGLAPGFPGLYQINVTIPTNLPALGKVAMGINTPDAYHDQINIPIQ